MQVEVSVLLRGACAFYAATAHQMQITLITWDDELLKRAGGLKPDEWLVQNAPSV